MITTAKTIDGLYNITISKFKHKIDRYVIEDLLFLFPYFPFYDEDKTKGINTDGLQEAIAGKFDIPKDEVTIMSCIQVREVIGVE